MRFLGHAFHNDATTSRPMPTHMAGELSNENFATTMATLAPAPRLSGPYPLRRRARNPRAATATNRNTTVAGSRYLTFSKKPKPNELRSPA